MRRITDFMLAFALSLLIVGIGHEYYGDCLDVAVPCFIAGMVLAIAVFFIGFIVPDPTETTK
jgi:hypothetical protein